ncbi:hypothetical protein ACTXJX_10795 [Glutamicibacter ardleyensis]|uniref:hypothetical protein n=1 Tax=Glutamicibacter ardleyensis TaxID=225894 RepID=UPI003FD31EA3
MNTKNHRGFAAAISTVAVSALLLTGCAGGDSDDAGTTGNTAATALDGVYINMNDSSEFAVIADDTIKIYEPNTGWTDEAKAQAHLNNLNMLLTQDSDGLAPYSDHPTAWDAGQTENGTFRKINGVNLIQWNPDGEGDLIPKADTVEIDGDEYFPLDSDLAKDLVAEAQAEAATAEDRLGEE